jgi:Fatty acid hydroxylase superfamily
LLPRLRLPSLVETALAVLLLDYTLYIWHVLTHKVPLLWRLHRVHHSDLDLSASTALRFHFVEMIVSAPWRAAQVALIGVSPRQLSLWQTLTTMAILFHHSNIRLPLAIERALARVVAPRMHGIHLDRRARDGLKLGNDLLAARLSASYGAAQRAAAGMPFAVQRPSWWLGGFGPKPDHQEPSPARGSRLTA